MNGTNEAALIPLAEWLDAIRNELTRSQNRYLEAVREHEEAGISTPVGFALKDIVIEANVTSELSGGADLDIWVVSAKAATSNRACQKLTIRLEPAAGWDQLLGKKHDSDDDAIPG